MDEFRRRADRVRRIPLEVVLTARGARRDKRDKSKWHTEQGPLSVTGPKFINWHGGQGGGGAIDLVMHLAEVDFSAAVTWLEQRFVGGYSPAGEAPRARRRQRSLTHQECSQEHRPFHPPVRDDRLLGQVREYLTGRRHLAHVSLEPLIASGRVYADSRGNAVFLLVAGKAQRPVGAELRGTGPSVWRGMAAGSRKDAGYFWVGTSGSRSIVLCESAIDCLSCFQMHPQQICISTSGVRANPAWLGGLLARGYAVHCGFDADEPGDTAAARMIAAHPQVQRLRPPAHDWNDALA